MDEKKRKRKSEIKAIKTKREYYDYINSLLLNDEQKRICDLIFLEGRTYIQIGEELHCSETTVKRKVSKIFDKMM